MNIQVPFKTLFLTLLKPKLIFCSSNNLSPFSNVWGSVLRLILLRNFLNNNSLTLQNGGLINNLVIQYYNRLSKYLLNHKILFTVFSHQFLTLNRISFIWCKLIFKSDILKAYLLFHPVGPYLWRSNTTPWKKQRL